AFVRLTGLYRLKALSPAVFPDFLLYKEAVPDKEIEVEAVSGACMMVPRRTINEVGGFDEDYFLHVEDLDWCMRIRQKGWKILFVPGARVVHFKGVCSNGRPVFVEWHKHLGFARFYRKLFAHRYYGILMPMVMAGVWFHFLLVLASVSLKAGLERIDSGTICLKRS
ncbi:MAG: glycosyltransferase family 2 protein, partial [Thermodesulfobacteriota bacterium]